MIQQESVISSIHRSEILTTPDTVCEMQIFWAIVLLINFACNIAQSQVDAEQGSREARAFDIVDVVFNIVYTIEIALNLYGHWWRPFFMSKWSLFDLSIISVSWLAEIMNMRSSNNLDMNILRLLRIFRVVRVFNKLRQLQLIIQAMFLSIVPVLSAFLVVFVIISIYAIIGVAVFHEETLESVGTDDAPKFKTFWRSFLTMLGIFTGADSWKELLDDLAGMNFRGPDFIQEDRNAGGYSGNRRRAQTDCQSVYKVMWKVLRIASIGHRVRPTCIFFD